MTPPTKVNFVPIASIVLFLSINAAKSIATEQPSTCSSIPTFNHVLGFGWDALTNKNTNQTLHLTYSQCKVTNDGRYLIPDETVDLSKTTTETQVLNNLIEYWLNYSPITARGYEKWPQNAGSLYFTLSHDYLELKKYQSHLAAFTSRSQVRRLTYRIAVKPNVKLSTHLKTRLLEVIKDLSLNHTKKVEYLVHTIVNDYGTHYTKSVDIGAVFVKDDHLHMRFFYDSSDCKNLSILASSNGSLYFDYYYTEFQQLLKPSMRWLQQYDGHYYRYCYAEYKKTRVHTEIQIIGGAGGQTGWLKRSTENMVTIDRSGDLLTRLITSSQFPRATSSVLSELRIMLETVIQACFNANRHPGCVHLKALNYDYFANQVDDQSCKYITHEYAFGGFSKTVVPAGIVKLLFFIKNSLTDDFDCPHGFQSVNLYSKSMPYTYEKEVCTGILFWKKCEYVTMMSSCPDGYRKHSAINYQNCQISYCLKPEELQTPTKQTTHILNRPNGIVNISEKLMSDYDDVDLKYDDYGGLLEEPTTLLLVPTEKTQTSKVFEVPGQQIQEEISFPIELSETTNNNSSDYELQIQEQTSSLFQLENKNLSETSQNVSSDSRLLRQEQSLISFGVVYWQRGHCLSLCRNNEPTYLQLTRSCPDVPKLNILPGVGWDGLTNQDTKQLTQLTYDQCKLTNDGRYMIPDHTVTVAVNDEKLRIFAEIFEDWSKYTPPTASFNSWPQQYPSLRYSFSDEYQEMKTLQVKHDAFTSRSQLRQLFYRVHATSDARMIPSVKERFLEVIRALNRNYTERATYLVEMIVGDYGTHYAKSIDVGTVFVKEDYLQNVFLNVYNDQRGKILSASKLSLLEYIDFSWKDKQNLDSSLLSEYNKVTSDKKIRLFGSPNWEKDVSADNMMAIDKSGTMLTSLVTSSNFPNVSTSLLIKLQHMLDAAVEVYISKNIHRGCTQLKSTNFDFIANFNDGYCIPVSSNYVFGGVYERCSLVIAHQGLARACTSTFITNNLLTGATSCPQNFEAPVVHSQYSRYSSYDYRNVSLISCIANSSLGTNLMFGGLYSSNTVNIHTKSPNCPLLYTGVAVLGRSLTICVHNGNKEAAKHYALPFGGFATCFTEFQCPAGYKKYLAVNVDNINIYYCLLEPQLANFGVVSLLNRPPFGNLISGLSYGESPDEEYDEYGFRAVPEFKLSHALSVKAQCNLLDLLIIYFFSI
uniref:MACPF domain-containing protein n=1 Tax=Strigamia maritima TaxID=126957 RepID=T1JLV4_STRMM